MYAFHHIVTMMAWRLKTIYPFQFIEQCKRWLFKYAHGTVALYVTMTAHGAGACAGFAYTTFQQQQVHYFFDRINSIFMLCQAHSPASYYLALLFKYIGSFAYQFLAYAAVFYKSIKVFLFQFRYHVIIDNCILCNKIMIEYSAGCFFLFL